MASNKENRKKLQNFKTEVANSLNVNLKQGYNGDLTSRQARLHRRRNGKAHDRLRREQHEQLQYAVI